jgi:pimeloyl-ACP methyl ester carboxylesterase
MKTGVSLIILCILVLALAACGCSEKLPAPGNSTPSGVPDTSGIPAGNGHYAFIDTRGNADRPISVYTYRPVAWNTSGPILFVMPGAGRAGGTETWIPYSEQYSALIVSPEFSTLYYPTDYDYNGGNMFFPENMTMKNKENWTFTAIEHLFDDVRSRTGSNQETYLIFGHSAGGQFVHRMALFLPEARFSRAVAANPGLYAMPDPGVWFPFGLKGSPLAEDELKRVFSKKLIIMSGELDTDPNDPGLANFPEAEAQGSTRFERAQNFIGTARQEAARLNVPLAWEYHTVPGVGHSESGMAVPSAALLFNGT